MVRSFWTSAAVHFLLAVVILAFPRQLAMLCKQAGKSMPGDASGCGSSGTQATIAKIAKRAAAA
jgi:hypothetical protein